MIDSDKCNDCIDQGTSFATVCSSDETDPYVAMIDFQVPNDFTFCSNQNSFFYHHNQDVDLYASSYEILEMPDEDFNVFSSSLTFSTISQADFNQNGTSVFLSFCNADDDIFVMK